MQPLFKIGTKVQGKYFNSTYSGSIRDIELNDADCIVFYINLDKPVYTDNFSYNDVICLTMSQVNTDLDLYSIDTVEA